MTKWDDKAHIEAAKQDPDAFGEIYEQYIDRIYSYIYHRVGKRHDTEDLTSRTFYRALSHLSTYEDKGLPFSAWLYRIAHNLVANWHRDRSRKPVVALEALVTKSSPSEHPEVMALMQDDNKLLENLFHTLSPVRRELLVLKFSEGLSNAEIGSILGRSEGAIKSLYHRTLLQMRKEMIRKGVELPADDAE